MNQSRLYRSSDNRMIAGVAGGLADYFHMDPSLIRLIWVLVVFLGGAGLLVYLIAWAVIPSQDSLPSQSYSEKNAPPVVSVSKSRYSFTIGAVLIGLGLLFLLVEVFSFNFSRYFWPIILIGGGAVLLFGTGGSPKK